VGTTAIFDTMVVDPAEFEHLKHNFTKWDKTCLLLILLNGATAQLEAWPSLYLVHAGERILV
jgi:hypothetical protein